MFDESIMWREAAGADRIGIVGHIRPDGDCIGSCLGLYAYLKANYSRTADIYLDEMPDNMTILEDSGSVITTRPDAKPYDLLFVIDCGDRSRLGKNEKYLKQAVKSYCIDHHATNSGFCDENLIVPDAAATAQVLFNLMDPAKITRATAEALYLGIVHDTGIFKHSNTTRHTMEVAGKLLEYGISPTKIIDATICERTYLQNQILGRCLMESILLMDGRVIVSKVDRKVQALYGLSSSDTDGVIDQMRITKGVEVAMLLKEMNPRVWRVSMRSQSYIDVAAICGKFGGGGHIRAAGCTLNGSPHDVVNTLTREIEFQMQSLEKEQSGENL